MTHFLTVTFIVWGFLIANVVFDHYAWKKSLKGKKVNHSIRYVIRFGCFVLVGFFNIWLVPFAYFFFYLLFDPLLAISMGHPFFYMGTTAKWDGVIRSKPVKRFVIELVLTVVSVAIYFFNQSSQ